MRRVGMLLAALVLVCGAMAQAAVVEVTGGLNDYQVVQCDDAEKGVFNISGTADTAGIIHARVVGEVLEVLPWAAIATVENNAWSGAIANIPVGGPYQVEIELRDASGAVLAADAVRDALVGDVWMLAGQSNMQGVGNRYDMSNPHPQIHHFAILMSIYDQRVRRHFAVDVWRELVMRFYMLRDFRVCRT